MGVPDVVVDASSIVELLLGGAAGDATELRLRDCALHAPAHLDAEVLSALGRLHRADRLSARAVHVRLERFIATPIERHPLAPLLEAGWRSRANLRLQDGLYGALSDLLDAPVITTDRRLAGALKSAELIES